MTTSGHRPPSPSGYTPPMNNPVFHKSSYSGASGACVEIAQTPTATLIRDTQHRNAGHLPITPGERAALLRTC